MVVDVPRTGGKISSVVHKQLDAALKRRKKHGTDGKQCDLLEPTKKKTRTMKKLS